MEVDILVVEHEFSIVESIKIACAACPYRFTTIRSGRAAVEIAKHTQYALIILDALLPDMSGIEVCRELRNTLSSNQQVPIIVLGAPCSNEAVKLTVFQAGADDYLVKPFSYAELAARIKVWTRRMKLEEDTILDLDKIEGGFSGMQIRHLRIDPDKRKVTLKGREVILSRMEYELLVLLARNAGRAYSRFELLRLVWGLDSAVYEKNVTCLITRLRQKIEINPENPSVLQTVRGFGYRIAEE